MHSGPLRFMSYMAPIFEPLYAYVAGQVALALGIETKFAVGKSYEQITTREADAVFLCGLAYVVLNRSRPRPLEAIAAPVLHGDRYQGRPIYFSDVIVRRGADYSSFKGLRGCTWAYNEPLSQSGYGIVREKLRQLGETFGFFGQVVQSGWHQRSIRMVADGQVDASAIDSHVLAAAFRDHPALADELQVIDVLGPSTAQPLAISTSLPQGLQRDLQAVIMGIRESAEGRDHLERGLAAGFAPMRDESYDDIRGMVEAAERVGFTDIG